MNRLGPSDSVEHVHLPYPTEREVISLTKKVFDVKDNNRHASRDSRRARRYTVDELDAVIDEEVIIPLKSRFDMSERDVSAIDYSVLKGVAKGIMVFYKELERDVNVGDLKRKDVMPILLEEVAIPLLMHFLRNAAIVNGCLIDDEMMKRRFCSDANFVRIGLEYLSQVCDKSLTEGCFQSCDSLNVVKAAYPLSTGVDKSNRDGVRRWERPDNTRISKFIRDLRESRGGGGSYIFSDEDLSRGKGLLLVGAVVNRCKKLASRYVDEKSLQEIARASWDAAGDHGVSSCMIRYKRNFSDRISLKLGRPLDYVYHPRVCYKYLMDSWRYMSFGLYKNAVDAALFKSQRVTCRGGDLEYFVVAEVYCMLAFLYRSGRLFGDDVFYGVKLKSQIGRLREMLNGFRPCVHQEGTFCIGGVALIPGNGESADVCRRAEINDAAIRFAVLRSALYGNRFGISEIKGFNELMYFLAVINDGLWSSEGVFKKWMRDVFFLDNSSSSS